MIVHREGIWAPGGTAVRPLLAPRPWWTEAPKIAALGLVGGLIGAPFGYGILVGLLFVSFGGAGLFARMGDDWDRQRNAHALALREEFGLGPAWPVDLIVRQGEAPTGRDQGLFWIENGQIMFAGLRTSFALSAGQVAGAVKFQTAVPGVRLRLNLELDYETPTGPLSLSFWPLADGWNRAESDASALRFAIDSTIQSGRIAARHHPLAPGQWPPTQIGPGALAPCELRRAIWGRIGLCGAVGLVVATPVALGTPPLGGWVFLILILVGILLTFAENRQRRLAYRDAVQIWGTN